MHDIRSQPVTRFVLVVRVLVAVHASMRSPRVGSGLAACESAATATAASTATSARICQCVCPELTCCLHRRACCGCLLFALGIDVDGRHSCVWRFESSSRLRDLEWRVAEETRVGHQQLEVDGCAM
jgi:hypothetical protein